MLEDRNVAQVSMNMVNYEGTPLYYAYEMIRALADRWGVRIIGTRAGGSDPGQGADRLRGILSEAGKLRLPQAGDGVSPGGDGIRSDAMQLAELTVRGFADLLGSDAPAPGGGSAAALAGALGAALTAMVGSLTVGRKKYAEFDGLARETLEKARDLEHRFLDVMERDTEAFNAVSAVFAMPKGTDQEKEAQAAAMQEALQGCTKTPFEMMELSLEALRLTDGLVDRSNASAASDLGCAALHLGSAVQGAWLNVLINLGSIRDAAFAAQYRTRGQILLDEALPLSQRIYGRILEMME